MKKRVLILPVVFSLLLSCNASVKSYTPTAIERQDVVITGGSNGASKGDDAKPAAVTTGGTSTAKESDSTVSPSRPVASVAPSAIGSVSDAGSASSPTTSDVNSALATSVGIQTAKKLSGGSTDDNDKFLDYIDYVRKMNKVFVDKRDVIKFDTSEKYNITVTDKNNKTISDAKVTVSLNTRDLFTAKSYSDGKVLFFPKASFNPNKDCQQTDCAIIYNEQQTQKAYSQGSAYQQDPNGQTSTTTNTSASNNTPVTYTVTVQKGNTKVVKDFDNTTSNWNVQLDMVKDQQNATTLDLMFLIDSTGSMSDEIGSIQKTIKDVSDRIQSLPNKPTQIRYGLVTYRDKTDAYVVKRYDFTNNLTYFQETLNGLQAGGGGDYPESLNEGLTQSINKVSWTDDNAVRLVFIVADAPPHLDYTGDYQYVYSMSDAVKKGIKIYTLAASGLTDSGEYIFRQLSQYTASKFLFITYGGDQQNSGTTTHQVGTFKENNLDDIFVNVVKDELDNLNK